MTAAAQADEMVGQQPKPAKIAAVAAEDGRSHETRISSGDVVELKIFGLPEMSQVLRVNIAGVVTLPMIGAVKAEGLTISELEQAIAAALRDGGFMNDPQVTVLAKEMHSSGVSVSGEVGKPGIYPVFGDCNLLELIMNAGGLTPRSGHIVTITHRDQPDKPISVDLSLTAVNADVAVFSGDAVVVTKAPLVYVLGEVGHPTGLVMEGEERLTVLQALAMAGGAGKDAKFKGARILRKGSQGVLDVPVPLKEILNAKVQDMDLLPGDVLFIPGKNSEGRWRSESSILQAATLLAIFRP